MACAKGSSHVFHVWCTKSGASPAGGGLSPFSDGVMATAIAGLAADLSGDGSVDSTDLAIMLAAWGTINGDLSGDGDTDSTDIAILLAAWG